MYIINKAKGNEKDYCLENVKLIYVTYTILSKMKLILARNDVLWMKSLPLCSFNCIK